MTPHTFVPVYSVGDPFCLSGLTIILERVTHWRAIPYNGTTATEIFLDSDVSVRVNHFPMHIELVVKEAFSNRNKDMEKLRNRIAELEQALSMQTALSNDLTAELERLEGIKS